jgi:hypothetical protein
LQILKNFNKYLKSFYPCDVLHILQVFCVHVNFESNKFLYFFNFDWK